MLTREDLRAELRGYATKEDLDRFATKEDLERFATKEDLTAFPTRVEMHAALAELRRHMVILIENQTATMHTLFDGLNAKLDAVTRRVPELDDHERRIGSLELRTTALERRRKTRT